jgi:5'-3' exonuclease
MGIPSYFSHIIRKYPKIVSSFQHRVNNFYLDSNSIIYDAVARLDKSSPDFEKDLMDEICRKIDEYLLMVNPQRVMIAFDGVPPLAKIKQQRERRYKGLITQRLLKQEPLWNTIQITPGTVFMKKLNSHLTNYFQHHPSKYTYFKLSTSDEAGEGEHKIFEHIREFPDIHATTQTMIYGLDSDLIVLSLHHLSYGNIRLLREAPSFLIDSPEPQVLDVRALATGIQQIVPSISDYVLLTLFLGNDFMPHFPALNLRSNGMDTLLKCYDTVKLPLYEKGVLWSNLKTFLQEVSRHEFSNFCREHAFRTRYVADVSTEEKRVNSLPVLEREKEVFINPTKKGWEQRYYSTLVKAPIADVCKNFTDMVEWNMQYYTTGCACWSLYYHHMYPPLVKDLVEHIPEKVVLEKGEEPWSETKLLSYVLPSAYHRFMGGVDAEAELPTLEWSYCRYLWESHVSFK